MAKPIFLTPTLIMTSKRNAQLDGQFPTEELAVFSIAKGYFEFVVSFVLFAASGSADFSTVVLDASAPSTVTSTSYASYAPAAVTMEDDSRVITVRQTMFAYHHPQQGVQRLMHHDIVCPVDHFLSFCNDSANKLDASSKQRRIIPFSLWAAHNTHIRTSRDVHRAPPTVYGSRTMQWAIDSTLTMYDYRRGAQHWIERSKHYNDNDDDDEEACFGGFMGRAMLTSEISTSAPLEQVLKQHGTALTVSSPVLCVDREVPYGVMADEDRSVSRLLHDLETVVLIQVSSCSFLRPGLFILLVILCSIAYFASSIGLYLQ